MERSEAERNPWKADNEHRPGGADEHAQLLMSQPPPTFDAWLNYCFTLGHSDFNASSDDPAQQTRIDTFLHLPPPTLAAYIAQLFETAAALHPRFTPDQLGEGTWFLFGCGSCYFNAVNRPPVSADLQVRVYRAMTTLYTDLYDKLCNDAGDSDDDLSDTHTLDGAVYMIWDMGGGLDLPLIFPDQNPHLLEPGFETLQSVLSRCVTGSCLKSALHALGHLQHVHQRRVDALITAFLKKRGHGLTAWLRDYAIAARDGMVQ